MKKDELQKAYDKTQKELTELKEKHENFQVTKLKETKETVISLARRDASIQNLQLQLQHSRTQQLEALEALTYIIQINKVISKHKHKLEGQ